MRRFFYLILGVVLWVANAVAAATPTPADLAGIFSKNMDGQFIYKGHTAIALDANLAAVIYDKNNELSGKDYVKFDPYLGLYLVRFSEPLRASAMIDELDSKPDMWVMVLDKNASTAANNTATPAAPATNAATNTAAPTAPLAQSGVTMGHIKQFSSDIGSLDQLDFAPPYSGMLLCDCAAMVGIATGGDRFVPNRYLKHFMKYDDVYYGDIGVTFENQMGAIIAKSVNPFGTGAQLQSGDQLLAINGRPVQDLRDVNETILFAPKGSSLKLTIKRGNEERSFDIQMSALPSKKQNEGLAAAMAAAALAQAEATKKPAPQPAAPKPKPKPTFAQVYGLTMGDKATIRAVKAETAAAQSGFKAGDIVMQIDGQPIKSAADIERIMAAKAGVSYWLISRDDFQFFVRVAK